MFAVTLEQLAETVGTDRFARARDLAWATAKGCGRGLPQQWPPDLVAVPHELADVVVGDLELAFTLYRAMPCYANLVYVHHWGVGPRFWEHLRALADEPDARLADPALYWLWCGPFERAEPESAAAWQEMISGAGELRLRRLLESSGPVPWPVKAPLLENLAAQEEWHATVRTAIDAAASDAAGSVDKAAAQRLLERVSRDTTS